MRSLNKCLEKKSKLLKLSLEFQIYKIDHKEINISLYDEFLSLISQYNKDLTSTYIKHFDILVHTYTNTLDDFPNKVR